MATENDYGDLIEPSEVELIARRSSCLGFREDEMPDLEQEIARGLLVWLPKQAKRRRPS